MATTRITAATVEGMAPGATLWDTEVKGFGARRQRRDPVYVVKARANGRQVLLTIGAHNAIGPGGKPWGPDAARREAKRLLGIVASGQDPAQQRDDRKQAPTLAAFADRYLGEYARPQKKPRTVEEDQRLLRRHILPKLGRIKVADLTRADVARMHSGMLRNPVAANRALALLSAMMGWAEKVGARPDHSNPCRHVDRYPEKERDVLLSARDLARLGEALDRAATGWTEAGKAAWARVCADQADAEAIPADRRAAWIAARAPRRDSPEDWRAIAAFRLLIFTGARLSEILTLRWEWVDAETGVARLPDSKTGAKNLPLSAPALAVLASLPRFAGNPHVLPGDKTGARFIGIQKPWQRVRALAGLPALRLHDLRHAFASAAVAAGDSLFLVGKMLGHRQASTTERYAHLAPDPVKAVADRTAERLAAMMEGERKGDPIRRIRGGG